MRSNTPKNLQELIKTLNLQNELNTCTLLKNPEHARHLLRNGASIKIIWLKLQDPAAKKKH